MKTKRSSENNFVCKHNLRGLDSTHGVEPGESAETFITAVHKLAERCQYGGILQEAMIRGRLLVGIMDHELSDCS